MKLLNKDELITQLEQNTMVYIPLMDLALLLDVWEQDYDTIGEMVDAVFVECKKVQDEYNVIPMLDNQSGFVHFTNINKLH